MPTSSRTPTPPTTPPKPTWDPKPVNVRPFPWLRPTIRIRLTLLYGGMFLMAGIVLLTIIYMLAANALQEGSELPVKILRGNFAATSNVCNLPNESSGEIFTQAIQSCLQHQRAQALNTLLNRSLLALLGLTVVAFAFGYAMAGRVLSPLGRITRTAQRVAGSDLHRRIELGGPDDELKELADTFDEMLDRLDRAFESQRRFVANASHELRTPLAINRTLLEVQLADPDASPELAQLGKTLLATNERSEQLVEGLLLLARSENKIVDKKPVDLAEVASQALDQARAEAQAKGVEIRGVRQQAFVQGNGVLLERIALNLVQNAVRYNIKDEGWVEVTTEPQQGCAVLVVSNTGPAVPAYEVENLFEPFRRLRTERTGSDKGVGLGLSIVRSVVRAHDGTITATPREGGGLEMRVVLPV
ncbi:MULTISPECIES: sensor histidine kinase [Streptomyces]|uniref:histidine kinase n=4 Tax=Streptomyces rimosus TaxID=1927 RepID=L8EQZ9_STRR1|nr:MULTISPECIES: HAMP domain-containing sensor histidine kinase [Streptomyces]KOG69915.1 histidine kinase [Kitasatospora aureofaciens]MYT47244.1 HAMP domain-containing protein [Streptomyces sp. SID5471]KEF03028.1 histidine kinase [Streptomyces rimosus]KEF18014.1 histidine kinase [Streptomyces rimosus]KOT30319.1 histidine kinase [Streptomyces rimosus subsp. rimosus]